MGTCFWDSASCTPGWPQTHYVCANNNSELPVLLDPYPKYRVAKPVPPHLPILRGLLWDSFWCLNFFITKPLVMVGLWESRLTKGWLKCQGRCFCHPLFPLSTLQILGRACSCMLWELPYLRGISWETTFKCTICLSQIGLLSVRDLGRIGTLESLVVTIFYSPPWSLIWKLSPLLLL